MTRPLVILIAALAAASLGASAQEHTTASQGNKVATQSSVQSTPPAQQSSNAPAGGHSQDAATSSPNQGIQASDPADADSPNRAQLPQTSTILPLLGLIGLGSLLAGLFARR